MASQLPNKSNVSNALNLSPSNMWFPIKLTVARTTENIELTLKVKTINQLDKKISKSAILAC